MNKYGALIFSVIYLMLISLIASSLNITTSAGTLPIPTEATGGGWFGGSGSLNIAKSFWGLVTFSIEGVPVMLSILFVYPVVMLLIWLIISLIRGTD